MKRDRVALPGLPGWRALRALRGCFPLSLDAGHSSERLCSEPQGSMSGPGSAACRQQKQGGDGLRPSFAHPTGA
eukprot:3750625-Alexandrium_andersonii.AAC.1